MNSRAATVLIVFAGLLATGFALQRFVRSAEVEKRGTAGGLLGGWRTFAADVTWLRAYATWERREAPATEALLELTVALDPRPLYFWLNGARMMAYDFPAWEIAVEGGWAHVPVSAQRSIEHRQAQRAMAFLAKARLKHPAAAALWIEQGNLELNRLHDVAAAATSYRRAAECPGAPYYAARIHAELLRRLGKKRAALDWLRQIYPTLPVDDEAADAAIVRSRIHALEAELAPPTAEH